MHGQQNIYLKKRFICFISTLHDSIDVSHHQAFSKNRQNQFKMLQF